MLVQLLLVLDHDISQLMDHSLIQVTDVLTLLLDDELLDHE